MDSIDRTLVNELQDGLPVCRRPFDTISTRLGISVTEVTDRISKLLDDKVLSRFGPMFNAERLGGGLTLCAMQVPEADFERVIEQVNTFPEVAHNYAREHDLNMWFVVATEQPERMAEVIAEIGTVTGCRVYDMPKMDEFYIGLKLPV
jgi:DNA-binding Lrp family transcriptional regulator